jgi:CheY-like chemotaxis protein
MSTKDAQKSDDKRKYILIVEDDEFISDVYQRKLLLEGFEVALAKDGEEALRTIRERRPDLVLLDIMIPLKDGFQVLSGLRVDAGLSDIRVVVMSNLSQGKDIADAMAQELSAETNEAVRSEVLGAQRSTNTYNNSRAMAVPAWLQTEAA